MSSEYSADDVAFADVDAAFAEVAARRADEAHAEHEHKQAYRSLWLAHHWPHRYERCAVISGRHVCRRCLWFYSVSLLTLAAAAIGLSPWPADWDRIMVWALALPATIEFLGGELGLWKYQARRQVVVTAILGLAVGRGFYAELSNPGSPTFWGPVLAYGSIWFLAASAAWVQHRGQYRP